MDPVLVGIVALLAGGAVGVLVGRSTGRRATLEEGRAAGTKEARGASEARLQALIDAVKRGRRLQDLEPGSVEARLQQALERGWAPREVEREAALREAVGRVSAFLHARVREPLAGAGDESDEVELRERIGRALGSLEDLDFFLTETGEARHGTDLTNLAQTVSREFAGDHDVGVRVMLDKATIRANVSPPSLMDALYLILHNAARFGGGTTIDLTVEEVGDRAKIRVRDRGEGFTEEAFSRAFDPFYSTSSEGLGLGLPHARKVIEEMGGHIELRNMPDGGAEVEVSLPLSG